MPPAFAYLQMRNRLRYQKIKIKNKPADQEYSNIRHKAIRAHNDSAQTANTDEDSG